MKIWLALATLALTPKISRAEPPVPTAHAAAEATAQDPLSRQIFTRQITQDNGGVTAAVRVGSGQAVELKLIDVNAAPAELKDAVADPKALTGLPTASGLTPAKATRKAAKKRPARRASEQLKAVRRAGWRQAP